MTRTFSLGLALLLAGCGAAPKRPAEPAASEQAAPSSAGATEMAPAMPAAESPQATDNLQMSSWQDQFAETLADTDRLDCPNACRALGSLERSASNICGLVGEKTSTCKDVQQKSADAKTRVRDRCGVCP